ncbi:MAG: hypothetical protein ABI488_23585 [Polyangiaceae bacterium]
MLRKIADHFDPPVPPPASTTTSDPDGDIADQMILRFALHDALHRYSPAAARALA